MSGNPADEGGRDAGLVDVHDHGMKFWERQANALRSALTTGEILGLDELRRAGEDLENYEQLSYFERTTSALRDILLEKQLISIEELEQKMAEVRKRYESA